MLNGRLPPRNFANAHLCILWFSQNGMSSWNVCCNLKPGLHSWLISWTKKDKEVLIEFHSFLARTGNLCFILKTLHLISGSQPYKLNVQKIYIVKKGCEMLKRKVYFPFWKTETILDITHFNFHCSGDSTFQFRFWKRRNQVWVHRCLFWYLVYSIVTIDYICRRMQRKMT